jgi:hypothetical protein
MSKTRNTLGPGRRRSKKRSSQRQQEIATSRETKRNKMQTLFDRAKTNASVTFDPELVTSNIETITPTEAKELLERSIGNRALSPQNLKRIRQAMRTGTYHFLGDPIRISCTNQLLDGHHRLEAAIAEDYTLQVVVIRGLPDEVFPSLDTNRKLRSSADALSIQIGDGTSKTRLRALLQAAWDYESSDTITRTKVSNEDMLVLYDVYDEADFWTQEMLSGKAKDAMHVGAIAAACMLIERAGNPRASVLEFARAAKTGVGLANRSPILALRNYVITKRMGEGITKQADRMHLMRAVITAWDKHIAATEVRVFCLPKSNVLPRQIKNRNNELNSLGTPLVPVETPEEEAE